MSYLGAGQVIAAMTPVRPDLDQVCREQSAQMEAGRSPRDARRTRQRARTPAFSADQFM
jgi:hypothetical protein